MQPPFGDPILQGVKNLDVNIMNHYQRLILNHSMLLSLVVLDVDTPK